MLYIKSPASEYSAPPFLKGVRVFFSIGRKIFRPYALHSFVPLSIDTLNRLSHNDNRCTALHIAVDGGKSEITAALLQHPNINTHIKDANGLTPYELAKLLDNQAILTLFKPSAEDPTPTQTERSPRATRN